MKEKKESKDFVVYDRQKNKVFRYGQLKTLIADYWDKLSALEIEYVKDSFRGPIKDRKCRVDCDAILIEKIGCIRKERSI